MAIYWTKKSGKPRVGVLCIDDEMFDVECNIYHDSIEKKFGHGNHGYKLYIPYKYKDGNEHIVKLFDKETMKVCAQRKIKFKNSKDNIYSIDDEIDVDLYNHTVQNDSIYAETTTYINQDEFNKTQNDDLKIEKNLQKIANIKEMIGKVIKLDEKKFLIEKSENENQTSIVLQNILTGLYLQHQGGKIVEAKKNSNYKDFISHSSFIPETRGDGFVLRCANHDLEEYYICKLDIDTYIVSEDLVEFVFYTLPLSENNSNECQIIQSKKIEDCNNEAKMSSLISKENNHETTDDVAIYNICEECCCNEEIFGCTLCINGMNYIIVPANDENVEHVSLLNMSNGCYALAYDDKIVDRETDMSRWFNHNSSFIAESSDENMRLHRVNKKKNNSYIIYSKINEEFTIGKESQAFVFAKEHSYKQWGNIKTILATLGNTFSKIKD